MTGYPNHPDAKKAIKALVKEFGWYYDDEVGTSSHLCGRLRCNDTEAIDAGEECEIAVYRTGDGTAKALWGGARKCPHRNRPDRRHW